MSFVVQRAIILPIAAERWWTLVVGEKDPSDEGPLLGVALETAYRPDPLWTVFARAERIDSDDLGPEVETVGKVSLGAIRDLRIHENAVLGVGALYSYNWVPDDLEHWLK